MISRLVLFLSFISPILAQDGGQLFTLYCSACHGADGKGATGGTFPPLAGSPWLNGDGDRAIKIVLHGLEGPVKVLGKDYNLAMPPQGVMLPDDQIAAILTHVRSSWGNKQSAITPQQVKACRKVTADRSAPWTSEEILKLHPLPLEATALRNLISNVYSGDWKELPDFSKLKPDSTEEEHLGIISVKQSPKTEHFAIVWQGDFLAPSDGDYLFSLDADDSARLFIDGKTVAEVTGIGAMGGKRKNEGGAKLSKGSHPIRIEYLEVTGNEGISLGWKPGKKGNWNWLSEEKEAAKAGPSYPSIPIQPSSSHTAIYRNFIAGTTPRAIAFGFPGGLNLAYSADHLAPELLWTGKFMDGGHHWTARGQGNEPPAGENVIKLSNSAALPEDAKFRGFKLDDTGNPTFSVQLGDSLLLDSWTPASGSLIRKLSLSGKGAPLQILISDILAPTPAGDHQYLLTPKLLLKLEGATLQTQGNKSTITLNPGQSATLSYQWKP